MRTAGSVCQDYRADLLLVSYNLPTTNQVNWTGFATPILFFVAALLDPVFDRTSTTLFLTFMQFGRL